MKFFTHSSEKYWPHCQKMINSFKKFHDEEMVVFRDELFSVNNYGLLGSRIDDERVMRIDSDCIICDTLDLSGDYEVGGVLNFTDDFIREHKFENESFIAGIKYQDYITCGVVVGNRRLWREFADKSDKFAMRLPIVENDVLNLIFYYGDFKTKILDNDNETWGNKTIERYEELYLEGDLIKFRGKTVKILHWAGGSGMKKLNYRDYKTPENVCQRLDYLTGNT